MIYLLHLRARPEDSLSPIKRHHRLIKCLDALSTKSWGFDSSRLKSFDASDALPIAQCALTRGFRTKVKGAVWYFNRDIITNHGRCDDVLDLEFDPSKQDYNFIMDSVFPKLVLSFGCYFGLIAEWEEWTERSVRLGFREMRTTVEQFDIVNYFDDTLCRAAFNLRPSQVARRLDGKVTSAELFANGILICTTRAIVDGETAGQNGESLMKLLKRKRKK